MSVRGGGRWRSRPPSVSPPPPPRPCRGSQDDVVVVSHVRDVQPSQKCMFSNQHDRPPGCRRGRGRSVQFVVPHVRLRLRCLCIHRSPCHQRPPHYICCHGLR
jgi:hypothetical protein